MRWLVLALLALTLTGCETTQEKAANLENLAKLRELRNAKLGGGGRRGLSITRASTKVRVTATALLHSSEGTAAVVTLRNLSATPLHSVPIALTVKSAAGATLYSNATPGLSPSLVSAPLLAAHGQLTWVDDQIQAGAAAASVSATVGEAQSVSSAVPHLSVEGVHAIEDPTNGPGAEGTLANHSSVTQRELVLYALARRGGRIVAAGRAILAQAPANSSTRFQLFFIGDPRHAVLEVTAPPSTLG